MTFILRDDAGRQVYIQTEFRVGYRIRRAVDDQTSGPLRAAPYQVGFLARRSAKNLAPFRALDQAGRGTALGHN